MPVPDHVAEQLLRAQQAKKRGESPTFGVQQHTPSGPPDLRQSPPPRNSEDAAQRMVDLEAMFGQQAAALDANIRAMMMTLRQLQQVRMEVFGRGPSATERAFSTQARTFGMTTGADGFLQRNPADSGTTPPNSTNEGGSNGNVSG